MTRTTRVQADWGHSETGQAEAYWDISFTPDQIAFAGLDDAALTSISVEINTNSGEVSLNNGYERGSAPYQQENELYSKFRDAIVQELLRVTSGDAAYAAFHAATSEGADDRSRRLKTLSTEIADAAMALEG